MSKGLLLCGVIVGMLALGYPVSAGDRENKAATPGQHGSAMNEWQQNIEKKSGQWQDKTESADRKWRETTDRSLIKWGRKTDRVLKTWGVKTDRTFKKWGLAPQDPSKSGKK